MFLKLHSSATSGLVFFLNCDKEVARRYTAEARRTAESMAIEPCIIEGENQVEREKVYWQNTFIFLFLFLRDFG
jgi:hypothetical protein